jgi:hypothetical protein
MPTVERILNIWNRQAMLEFSPQIRTAKGIAAKWLKHQGGTMGD